jgi:hypothetical protein
LKIGISSTVMRNSMSVAFTHVEDIPDLHYRLV